MRVYPGSEVRIANSESATLSLASDARPDAVRLVPKFSDPQEIALEGGEFEFPVMDAPEVVRVEWMSGGRALFETSVRVVSAHYFPLSALKGYGDGQDDFGEMPEEELFAARQAATEVFEMNAHRSFVHQVGRVKDFGTGGIVTLDSGDAYEVLTDGYELVSGSQMARVSGPIEPFPRIVEYLYGADSMPAQVSSAVLALAAYALRPSNRPIGATGESSDAGYIHFTVAGRDGATSIPEVNAAIEQFGRGVQVAW